jgi:hypothetical protein
VSDWLVSLRFNQLEADDALCGASDGAVSGPAAATGVPLRLPQPECEECEDESWPMWDVLK